MGLIIELAISGHGHGRETGKPMTAESATIAGLLAVQAARFPDAPAIRAPGLSPMSRGSLDRPPALAVGEAIAEVWKELLQCGSVGADDNFFAQGGDSLLATRAVSRLGLLFGVN